MNTLKRFGLISLISLLSLTGCHKAPQYNEPFANGADVSWLSEMEHDSMLFLNAAGEADDCLNVLKEVGCDAIRLRVWVNHATGWSNLPDVLGLAVRAHDAGLRLMIDIHYSDFFADPQRQDIPKEWQALNLEELCLAVGAHTVEVLSALKDAGIEPTWVQIGNETTNGMLWPFGALKSESGWRNYARLSNCGYEAAKQVFPNICCIVHVDNAFIPRVPWFRHFQAVGGKWDMIGLSHYPFTQDTIAPMEMNTLCAEDIRQLYDTFACPVMLTEIGIASWLPEQADACIRDFRQKTDGLKGYVGVFYWEPEVYGGWRPAEYIPLGWGSYPMGAFHEGAPMQALVTLYHHEEK
jgi:arabinogalactan endo-1,4-beta-galactosidase